ncbi:MAG: hypothetical protein DCC68_11820 [Planctomycetota bacterium]|nr:MAG: hypothetical protein DCC68_11820 [Planctomycetota bacterium]
MPRCRAYCIESIHVRFFSRPKAIRTRRRATRLRCEFLEPRTLLAVVSLIDSGSSVRALAPTLDEFSDFGFDWTGVVEPFDDSAWQMGTRGVGYDVNAAAPYASYIGTSVESTMLDNTATAFVRAPFTVVDPAALTGLTLRLRYDDGFIAWINGVEVLRRNALGTYPAWSSGAAAAHTATSAFSTFDMSQFLSLLQPGPNVLAVRGLNVSASDNDFLIQAELDGRDDRPPTAANDVAIGIDGVAVPIDVLGNDAPGTSPLDSGSVRIASPPQFGTATVNVDGTVSYTPRVGYGGADSFSYTVRDTSDVVGPGTTTRTLVSANATAKAFIPTDDELGRSWTGGSEPFNDQAWRSGTLGVGYDTRTAIDDYRPNYDLSVLDMRFVNASAYVRVPFSIDYPAEVQQLTLRMRFDDGFVAYVNGVEVARANAPTPLTYNSSATASTTDADAVVFQEFDISSFAATLEVGGNVLAIHGLNELLDSTDLLIQPELLATVTARGRVSNAATVQLNVVPPNPVANDDTAATLEQTPLAIDVLANDEAGPLGFPIDPTTVEIVAPPTNGTATVDPASGAITYSPGDEFTGQDSFTYRAFDTAPGDGVFGPLTVIPFNAVWKYLPLGPDQGPAAVWAAPEFDDSAWPAGPAELGYGDFDEATLLPADPVGTPTVYFRRTFDVADPDQVYELGITLYRDDGAVVYLNGVEVARSNMPAGPITFYTRAPQFTPDDGEQAFGYAVPRPLLESLLRPGTNTIAVEVHQYADISSDLSFELGLTAEVYVPPGRTTQTATVAVTVAPNPNKPASVADSYVLGEDETLVVSAGAVPAGVLENDTDPNLDTLTALLVAGPAHGVVSLDPDGSFAYTPAADFFGVDSFTYRASDGASLSLPTTATLTIEPRNDAPRTAPDQYAMLEGETLDTTRPPPPDYTATILAAGPIAYWKLGEPAGASDATEIVGGFNGAYNAGVTGGAAGAIVASADTAAQFNGVNGFIDVGYRPALNRSNNFTIEAWIHPDSVSGIRRIVGNPAAGGGFGFGLIDGRLRFTTYTIQDYDTQSVLAAGQWYHVAVVFDASNDATFYVNGEFFQRINGSLAARSSDQRFLIGAGPPYEPFAGRIDEVAVYGRALGAADIRSHYAAGQGRTDLPLPQLVFARGAMWRYRDNLPNGAAYPVDAQGDRWIEPAFDDSGWASGAALLGYGTINAAPIATVIGFGGNANDRYRTALFRRTFEATDVARIASLTFDMLIDDGAAIFINGREVLRRNLPGAAGDATLSTNTLAPVAGDEDNYQSVVVDLESSPDLLVDGTNTIAVEVHQTAPNSSDLGFDLSLVATVLPPPLVVDVLANDADPDGDAIVASLFAAPQHGAVDFRTDGTFVYTPAPGFVGVDTFTYTASDGAEESDATTVTVAVEHLPPAAASDAYATDEDVPLVISAALGVLSNDFDTLGHALTATLIAPPDHGTLTLGADGAFEYVPADNYYGPDRFTYVAGDGERASAAATVLINVSSVNDAPVANDDTYVVPFGASLDAIVPIQFSTAPTGSSVLLPIGGGDLFYDGARHRLYAKAIGALQRYDVAADQVLTPFALPGTVGQGDITSDSRAMYFADGATAPNLGYVQKLDLATAVVSPLSFARGDESGTVNLIIGNTDIAWIHGDKTSANTPVRRVDTRTDTITVQPGPGIYYGFSFHSGPDKSLLVLVHHALSDGGIATARGDTFAGVGNAFTWSYNNGVTAEVNRNGTLVALSCCGGMSIRSRTLQELRVLSNLSRPMAFDPLQDIFYATDLASDELVGLDTNSWQIVTRLPIGENVTGGGDMIVSSNGQFVFMTTPSGVRMLNVGRPGQQIGLLGNDVDPERDVLSVEVVQGPPSGTLEMSRSGTFRYTPGGLSSGTVSFTYRVSDGTAFSNVATATIHVLPVSTDLTGDGAFDRSDAAVLARNFGKTTGATAAQGDFDGDGAITLADAGILQAIMGLSLPGASGSSAMASMVPAAPPSAAEALVATASLDSHIHVRPLVGVDGQARSMLRIARRSVSRPRISEATVDALFAQPLSGAFDSVRARRVDKTRRLSRETGV